MNYVNKQLLPATTAAIYASEAILLDDVYMFAFQYTFTGSPVGNIFVQVSNDATKFPTNLPTNWTYLQPATAISASGSAIIEKVGAPYGWARIVYVHTSGAATLAINYVAKG